jgi:phosphoglycerol transferase MdoB-like AlkP superfamily enzyme
VNRLAVSLARLAFAGFWLLTAAYCVVAYVPFTYFQVIKSDVVPALNTFARLHPWIHLAVLAATAATLRSDLRRPASRRKAIAFLASSGVVAVALCVRPLLVSLGNEAASLRWAFAALVPVFFLAWIDVSGRSGLLSREAVPAGEDLRLFHASWASALFLAALYAAVFAIRFGNAGGSLATPLAWSVASHLVVLMGAFAAMVLVRAIAGALGGSVLAETALLALASVWAIAAAIQGIVLAAISLRGPAAWTVATAVASAAVAAAVGLSFRLIESRGAPAESGMAMLLHPVAPGRRLPKLRVAAWLLAIAVLAFVLASGTSSNDWNYLMQKVTALAIWVLAFAAFHASIPSRRARPRWTAALLGAAVLVLCGYKGLGISASPERNDALARYAGRDPSFKTVHDLLKAPRVAARDDTAFYALLQDHTNIPRSVHIDPADVAFARPLAPSSARKPNVFVIVVDSLRRDYLGAYNPKVAFTPAIAAFARDSVVFTNAFARYGGTGLSEPSIWVGGMIPHQEYVTPFRPMNALEKLLEAEGYARFLTLDTVLRAVTSPSPSDVEIDRDVLTHALRLDRSLADLAARLGKGEGRGRPIFAYTQPQDLHVSTLAREGDAVPAGESYPGFHPPYAWRVRRIDEAFGRFVKALRDLGLYDESIVVLTSDHGDSLGEDGRWGHAYTIYPEILRVPLIVHLPASLRSLAAADPDGLAFLTDITPSLFALLGHPSRDLGPLFGRPLFAARREELPTAVRARSAYLVASSYGPVYGILRDNGRRLYVADSVNYADELFDLATYPDGKPPLLTDAERAEYRALVREGLDSIDAFYKVPRAGSSGR